MKDLIVTFSNNRAKKDESERTKAIEKLKAKLEKTKNQKEYLSNYGYKKYLKITGESNIELKYKVKLQYQKMSPEKIRQTLIRVQTSIHYDKNKKIRYGLPSRISQDARKIYHLMEVDYKLTPYIIEKM